MRIKSGRKTRLVVILAAAGVAVWFVIAVKSVFIPFVFGFIIAYLFDPLVDYLEKWRLPRTAGIILVYLLLGGLLTMLVIYGIPIMFRDLNRMTEDLPGYMAAVQKMFWDLQSGYDEVPIPDGVRVIVDDTIGNIQNSVLGIIQGLAKGLLMLLTQAFNIILAPILSYYFLKEFNRMGPPILDWLPTRYRSEISQMGTEINQVIKRFIRGNLLVAFLVGLMATLGMYLIGMDFPLLIGTLVGITNFIPYFGAFISAIPAVLLALVKSKWLALYVLGVILVIQQLEGNIISPKILGDSVGLHPLVVIFALLAGGKLWGITGLLIGVPLAAVLRILGRHVYEHLV